MEIGGELLLLDFLFTLGLSFSRSLNNSIIDEGLTEILPLGIVARAQYEV